MKFIFDPVDQRSKSLNPPLFNFAEYIPYRA